MKSKLGVSSDRIYIPIEKKNENDINLDMFDNHQFDELQTGKVIMIKYL